MSIKKAYQPIADLLQANSDKKVSAILAEALELMSAKTSRAGGTGSTFIKDATGNTVAILDYYFKRWMPLVGPKAVEFGEKKGTPTGFNTMCKEGVSMWTKQQREAKNAETELLRKVKSKEIKIDEIDAYQQSIEDSRKAIAPTELGFATREELEKYLAKNGAKVEAQAA